MHPGSRPLRPVRFERFCREYIIDRNGSRSARDAGYSKKSAGSQAFDLLKKPDIKQRIAFLEAEHLAKLEMDKDEIVERLVSLVRADPNELMQIRIAPCRYCHGENGEYHWRNQREFNKAHVAWQSSYEAARKGKSEEQTAIWKRDNPEPTSIGGFGYKRTLPVNEECEECDGLGTFFSRPMDTTQLSPLGKALFAGVKETQNGIEIKTHDQMKALHTLAEIVNLTEADGGTGTKIAEAIQQIGKMKSRAPISTEEDEDDG